MEVIKQSASELVKLQQKVSKREKLSSNEEQLYNDYMKRLSDAAQNLTKIEEKRAEEGLFVSFALSMFISI